MESLNLGQYQPYLFLFIGIIAMIISLFYKSKTENLERTGERCEGIIFKLGYSNHATGFKADFVVLKSEPFRQNEFTRRIPMEFFGRTIYVVSPEDLIISKLIWIQELQ